MAVSEGAPTSASAPSGAAAPGGANPRRPRIGVTLGDPRGIGPEVVARALGDPEVRAEAHYLLLGARGDLRVPAEDAAAMEDVAFEAVGSWSGSEGGGGAAKAGRLAGAAVERGIELATAGEVEGLVTAPLSKAALEAAGYPYPGHTELLRDRTGVAEVTMMMTAESTPLPPPLDGPLRMALLTGHVALREVSGGLTVELAVTRGRIAVEALRDWWEMPEPRIAVAGLNPHAGEGGMLGDEEEHVLRPAARELERITGARVEGVYPADTVFRRCLRGESDLILVPYHDVGLAVLKTLALENGVNVTAGLPFPRTSPDHGTAFDIAGAGRADPSSMKAALRLCARFCRAAAGRGRP